MTPDVEPHDTIPPVHLLLACAGRHPHLALFNVAVNGRADDQARTLVEIEQPFERATVVWRQRRVRIMGKDTIFFCSKALQLVSGCSHTKQNPGRPAAIPATGSRVPRRVW